MVASSARLVIQDLHKTYRAGEARGAAATVNAVNGVSFEVRAGECFGLLGPNGAGKSSIINCSIGFYPATSGKVTIEGYDVATAPKQARYFLGVCPQEDTLDTDFTVWNQMLLHATFFGVPKATAKERSETLLKRFDLFQHREKLAEELSGGMRRRLQVARALISSPSVLVLDEPTTGLDPDARRSLWEIIGDLRSNDAAILLCTHYMEEAQRLCDRIAILSDGKILDIDSPEALIKKYVPTTEVTEEIRPGVHWKRPSNLEDVYLRLTGGKLDGGQGAMS